MNQEKEESIRYAKKYVEDLLSFFGLNTDVYATSEEDVIELSVPSTSLNGFLIGQRGETLRSIQYLVSNSLRNKNYELNRVNVDIADYKKQRHERLAEQVKKWISEVKESDNPKRLEPMSAADRRIVHKVVGEESELSTMSEGEGRDRHVVIVPTVAAE